MSKRKNAMYIFFIISLYLLCFQYFLENQIGLFKYIDEFYAILFFPVMLMKLKKEYRYINKNNIKRIILLIIIIFLGLLSNIIFKYQSIPYVLMDIILFLKFFLSMGLSYFLFNEELFCEQYNNKIKKHVKFIILILFFSTIINYLFEIWPNSNIRFGIMANQIFFDHPTKLAAVLIFLLTIYNIVNKGKIDIFNYLIYIMVFTTLRMKALLSLIVSIIILIYVKRKNDKIRVGKLAILGIFICILGYNTFSYYFLSDGFARTEIMRAGFKIASDYFPIGTGFGTFGSWPSGISYSPIYYLYGLNNIWGITPHNYLAIADSFWPTVLGQFGYLGIILYLIVIKSVFNSIQINYKSEYKYIYSSKLIAFVYLLISSTSESAFFNQLSVPLGIIIGLNFFGLLKEDKNNGNIV